MRHVLTIKGDPQMTLFFNRGVEAGKAGRTGRCPYVAGTRKDLLWAWELGRDQALEAAA